MLKIIIIIPSVIAIVIILFILTEGITIFPVKIIQTTENGQHTGIVTAVETNECDENYQPLQDNLEELKKMRLLNGKQLTTIELPMPVAQYWEGRRLPASYANFYISNAAVIVPTFRCIQDEVALDILSQVFADRKVIGIDSVDIVWGLGSFHCLSQQEPLV